ncbi:MAG: hypothetical protein ACR2OR_08515 [Hyphomicrobiales bacterium]
MSVKMHFATFLKLLTQSTGDKIRDLERYATPGGFDFYQPSRKGLNRYCGQGITRDQVLQEIENSSARNSKARNKEIFEKASHWIEKQSGEGAKTRKGIWQSPNRIFSVHIEPEISIRTKNALLVVAVYPRKDVRIRRDQAGAGQILLSRGYQSSGNEKFGILDVFGQRAFWTPNNVAEGTLDSEIAQIERLLKKIM